MKRYTVSYSGAAEQDLLRIFQYVQERASATVALAYVGRIRSECDGLASFPERGTPQKRQNGVIRRIAFEDSATIAFRVRADQVRIARILHHGRDFERHL